MLTEHEAADCDKLFPLLSVPGLQQSGGVRKRLFHISDSDRMGLAQWALNGASLQIHWT